MARSVAAESPLTRGSRGGVRGLEHLARPIPAHDGGRWRAAMIATTITAAA